MYVFHLISHGVFNVFRQKPGLAFIRAIVCFSLLPHTSIIAQKANLRINGEINCEDSSFCALIQIKAQDAQHFRIGTSSIALTYDQQVVSFLSYTSVNFDGSDLCYDQGNGSAWHTQNHIEDAGNIYITLTLKPDSSTYSCPEINDQEWIDIGNLCFEILDINGDPNLLFDFSTTPAGNALTFINSHLSNDGTNPVTISTTKGLSGDIFDCSSSIILADIDLQARELDTGRLSVHFFDPSNDSNPLYEYTITTNDQGHFTLSNIALGTYDICIKHPKSLKRVQRVNIEAGENNILFDELRMGDATNDNRVNIIDFSVLLSSYNKNSTQDGYKDIADFNGDQSINIVDFSVMLSNYNQTGENPGNALERLALSPKLNNSKSAVLYTIEMETDTQNDTSRILLQLESGKQAVDGMEAFLSFDPYVSEVIEVSLSNEFDVKLMEEFDNKLGQISMSAGFMESPFSGSLYVGEIVLVKKKVGNVALSFDQSRFKNTNITFRGESVLDRAFVSPPVLLLPPQTNPLAVYPNPSNGVISIAPPDLIYPVSLKIFDLHGKAIKNKIIISEKQLINTSIHISNKGIFNLFIEDNKNKYNNIFIVK